MLVLVGEGGAPKVWVKSGEPHVQFLPWRKDPYKRSERGERCCVPDSLAGRVQGAVGIITLKEGDSLLLDLHGFSLSGLFPCTVLTAFLLREIPQTLRNPPWAKRWYSCSSAIETCHYTKPVDMLLKNTICCIIQSPEQTTPHSLKPWLLQKQLENEDVAMLSLEKHLGCAMSGMAANLDCAA